jgi:four helix bundle protein
MATQSIVGEKSLAFAKRIAKCYVFLKEKKGETVMSKQLLRCGTSIGANVREGQYAQSKKDFISKMNIALKEAGEVMEQREQSEACFDFAESRQNSTIVKPTTG